MKRIFLFLMLAGLFACHSSNQNNVTTEGLNRHPSAIHYSRHARCRMDCRHIDAAEIKNILETGAVNYHKSELNADACHQKYAVEGYIKDSHLRVIFAPCNDVVTVVTCIDLGREWDCHCPGDNH